MSKSLAAEWGRYGMRVIYSNPFWFSKFIFINNLLKIQFNCLSPGPFETEGAFSRLDPTGAFRSLLKEQIPAGRMGDVEEVANLALYMVSDYSSWLNGTVIQLDGGKLPFTAGDFNGMVKIENEQWDQIEQIIRTSNTKSKL